MTRWRQRVGEEGVEWLLTETIEAARHGKVIQAKSFEKIIVDTTVSRLLERDRQHLVTNRSGTATAVSLRPRFSRTTESVTGAFGWSVACSLLAKEASIRPVAAKSSTSVREKSKPPDRAHSIRAKNAGCQDFAERLTR